MTDAEGLQELSDELAGAQNSPWQPACIIRAFDPKLRIFNFSMATWIALEAVRSPIIQGEDLLEVEDFDAALDVFGYPVPDELTPEESVALAEHMLAAVNDGFSTAIKMVPPGGQAELSEGDDGFGAWLPLFTCLVTQVGFSRAEALACPVNQAFALIAALRRNQGWRTAGLPYALRELGAAPTAQPDQPSTPDA